MRSALKQLPFIALLCILSAVLYIFFTAHPYERTTPPVSTFITCFSVVDGKRHADEECLHRAASLLLDTYSTKEIVNELVSTSSTNDLTNQCHTIAHIVGEETQQRTASVEEAIRRCPRACNSGCIHGVVGESVVRELGGAADPDMIENTDDATLLNIGARYCKENAPGLCHAIGHVFYMHAESLTKALPLCDAMGKGSERCYQGVFMEASGALNSLWLHEPSRATSSEGGGYPCDDISLSYRHACFLSLPMFQHAGVAGEEGSDHAHQAQHLRETCERLDASMRADCFEGYGYELRDTALITGYCDELKTPLDRNACTLGIMRTYASYVPIETALNYCSGISEPPRVSLCYDATFSLYASLADLTDNEILEGCRISLDKSECVARFDQYRQKKTVMPDYQFGIFGPQKAQ